MSTPQTQSLHLQQQPEHPISLKVMRLRRPECGFSFPVVCEPSDILGDESTLKTKYADKSLSQKDYNNLVLDGFAFNEMWTLPNSFGKIFVGETFSSYISLHNFSYHTLKNISLKAELLTGNHRVTLLDLSNSPLPEFQPGTNHDFIVEKPLSEQGMHILICTVKYHVDISPEPKSFRKIFKFPVSNPIEMKSVKVYTFQDRVFVHLELRNLTEAPLYIDSVKLDPSVAYTLKDHSTHNTGEYYTHLMLKNECRRFLYELIPKQIQSNKGVTALGKISLQWKGNMGESGMLVTNTIQHKGVVKQEIDLSVIKIQESINVEEPFQVTFRILNRSNRNVNLNLCFNHDQMFPLAMNGSSLKVIGEMEPNESKDVTVKFFALRTGVHILGRGILIKDLNSSKSYSYANLLQLYVNI